MKKREPKQARYYQMALPFVTEQEQAEIDAGELLAAEELIDEAFEPMESYTC